MFALLNRFAPGAPRQNYRLEVLSRRPDQPACSTPLVFVHGAYMGAWCWEQHFLPYFAARGYECHAVSLRGHGGSEGGDRLDSFGIDDYVSDLASVVADLPGSPVVIGHSMGGMVVQKFLERHEARAAVLMASVPPTGVGASAWRLLAGDPLLLMHVWMAQGRNRSAVHVESARRAMFSGDLPEQQISRYVGMLQPESHRAIWDMTVANLPRGWRIDPLPMLVMGAENDALFSPRMVQATARTYGSEAVIFPGMAHGMMLESAWQDVADHIIHWLREQQL